jgi:hypothetical protein
MLPGDYVDMRVPTFRRLSLDESTIPNRSIVAKVGRDRKQDDECRTTDEELSCSAVETFRAPRVSENR